ncbi:MAG: ACT domain-containing protein [Clostridia bacterium]|nr:ACT domain-containing protein [Clostridia bacterium]
MRAVISVIGKDTVGILAAVSAKCAQYNINIMEVTQSVLQDMFVMIMMTDISAINADFSAFADEMNALGEEKNLSIRAMHEDIFNAMHTI